MNKEVLNVSERVKHTKKEIEQLKTELDKLINLGTHSSKISQLTQHPIKNNEPTTSSSKLLQQPSTSQAKILNTKPQSTKQKAPPVKQKVPPLKEPPPLCKTRNPEIIKSSREYIKKQREKRAELLKAHIDTADNKLDLKKQKLRELHQKALELVNKNVELKRQRSKSRERIPEIRLDKANPRSRSQEVHKQGIRLNQRTKSQERAIPKCTQIKEKSPPRNINTRGRSQMRNNSQKMQENVNPTILQTQQIIPEITLNKPVDDEIPSSNSSKKKKNDKKKVFEHSVMTDACLVDTKETQTNQEIHFKEPIWLQPSAPLPYPYNFINTVKRKLQHAINSPRVGTELTNAPSTSTITPETFKSKDDIKELLKKSTSSKRVESFASHKHQNLDLKVIDNLELIPNRISMNLFNEDCDSESDTSKNIPEISSESIEVSKRSDSETRLSLEKINELKLAIKNGLPKLTSASSPSKTNSIGEDSYSMDFPEESREKEEESEITTRKNSEHSQEMYTLTGDLSSDKENSNDGCPKTVTNSIPNVISQDIVSSLTKSYSNSTMPEVAPMNNFDSLKSEKQGSSNNISTDLPKEFTKSLSQATESLSLKEPSVSLITTKDNNMKNITIRPSTVNNTNEIHLKFEAEVRLLNDFNESFKQFMTVEKAFEHLKNQKESQINVTKILQNMDTQTSIRTKTSTNTSATDEKQSRAEKSINYSRGSDIIEEINSSVTSNRLSIRNSTLSSEIDFNNINETTFDDSTVNFSVSNLENYNVANCAGLSLNMFEQLIKDEDNRIQHLKAIIKIREQALLDRTKGELVWLEIQRKQLIETGKIEEASLVKKRQRGIILKHEQERNEIRKLKQMQKAASEERKNILKQQRNLIKSQLSTRTKMSKIKRVSRERRNSGPLKVSQSCSESIHSETSVSRRSSIGEEILSVNSVSITVEKEVELDLELPYENNIKKMEVSKAQRTLFMREAELQKRRKAAEELLRWHRKLLDEEKKIAELEEAAASVIKEIPKIENKYAFSGRQLNQLWKKMTGRDEQKFIEEKIYEMSQMKLEQLRKSGRQYSKKINNAKICETSTEHSESDMVKKGKSDTNYSSIFEPESVQEIINSQEEKTKISSISELIDNFSKIEDEISLIGKKSEHDITSIKEADLTAISSQVDEETKPSEEPSIIEVKSDEEAIATVTESPQSAIINTSKEKEEKTEESAIPSDKIVEHSESSHLILEEAIESASKIEESLDRINSQISGKESEEVSTEETSTLNEIQSIETSPKDHKADSTSSSSGQEKVKVDVKKRVSEILADANGHNNREDRSPRLQDLYVTAYDVNSSEFTEPAELPTCIFGSEAEELWKKQLAIEQEIKQLELQQKEQIPYVFMREIPNKPPPPYTPPSSLSSVHQSIVPASHKEINEITNYTSKVIFKAYQLGNLDKVKFNENSFKLFSKIEISKQCGEFLFNICKDLSKEYYKQFEKEEEPVWLTQTKKPQWAKLKCVDSGGLEKILNSKLKELFGFKKPQNTESAIIKWGKKKRDHVDDILVVESQEEESQWTNFDKDELIVKDQAVSSIMNLLIGETAAVFMKILSKKMNSVVVD